MNTTKNCSTTGCKRWPSCSTTRMPPSRNDLHACALHEAGHAVFCSAVPSYALHRVELHEPDAAGFVAGSTHCFIRSDANPWDVALICLAGPAAEWGYAGCCYVDSDDFHNARRALSRTGVRHQIAWDAATTFVLEE